MALSTFVGSLVQPTSTGNQSVTGVGFQPKALVFWLTKRTADGSEVDASLGLGMATTSSARASMAYSSIDASASSNTDRRVSATLCILLADAAGAALLSADLVSMDADGFTVNWSVVSATQRIISYMAIGGTDLTNATVVQVNSPTSTGNQSTTLPGFQPDCLIAMTMGAAAVGAAANALMGVGWGTSSTQRESSGISSEDAQTTMDTDRVQVTDKLLHCSFNGSVFLSADLVSMDATGFTVNWTTVQASARLVWYLCLRGGQYKVGTATQKTSIGTEATVGVGFQPTGLLLQSVNNAANSAIVATARYSFGGASDTTHRGTVWIGDTDAALDSITDEHLDRTKIISMLTEGTPTVDAEADLSSFDGGGFTLNWTVADGTARQILYLAFGSVGAAAQTISPSGIASTVAFGTAALSGMSTISPSAISGTSVVGEPALSGASTISPSSIASTTLVGEPTLTSMGVISPEGIDSTLGFGTLAITGAASQTISPNGIGSTSVVGQPVLSAGGVTISPASIASTLTFGTLTISHLLPLPDLCEPFTVLVGNPIMTFSIENPAIAVLVGCPPCTISINNPIYGIEVGTCNG